MIKQYSIDLNKQTVEIKMNKESIDDKSYSELIFEFRANPAYYGGKDHKLSIDDMILAFWGSLKKYKSDNGI